MKTAAFALARAAIAAMREPTEEMIDAWISAAGAIKGGWQAMIDCALRETGKGGLNALLQQHIYMHISGEARVRVRFDCCERWGLCHGHSK
jgi:hypothetical protein